MATSLVVKNDQAAITGIRNSGARQLIIAPGNAYTGGHNVRFVHKDHNDRLLTSLTQWNVSGQGDAPNSEYMYMLKDPISTSHISFTTTSSTTNSCYPHPHGQTLNSSTPAPNITHFTPLLTSLTPSLTPPTDNLAIDIHEYFDINFSGDNIPCVNPAPPNLYGLTQWLQQHNLKAMITEFGGNPTSPCQADVAGIIKYMANNDEYIGWSGMSCYFAFVLRNLLARRRGVG